jgi:glycosyltransferase involved in cell wall biosynthesis
MPVYNIAAFIGEAIASIAAQDYPGCQVAVVDDGSTDGTYEAAEDALADPRLHGSRLVTWPHQRYVRAANEALRIALAEGAEIIARLDGDDVQHPTRISKQVALLEAGADVATTEMWFFGAGMMRRNNVTGPMNVELYGTPKRGGGEPCCGSIVAWSHVYQAVGGFDPAWEWSPDSDWNFRVIRTGRFTWAHVPEFLYGYRHHAGQTTHRHPGEGVRQYHALCDLHREIRLAAVAAAGGPR